MVVAVDLKSIGEVFKTKRHELGISLKEAENATSIRMSYLQAIEEGEVHGLIAHVYAEGFIKHYAIFLGLGDDHDIMESLTVLNDISAAESSKISQKQDFACNLGAIEVRGNPGRNVKWLPNIAWIGVSVLMIIAAWYLAKFFEVL